MSQNTNDEYNFTAILHTKVSNKRFIIQRFRFPKILTCHSLCTVVPLPSKKSGRERLCYGGGNRVPRRVVSPECVGNDLIGFHKNYFNLFCIIPKPCFD